MTPPLSSPSPQKRYFFSELLYHIIKCKESDEAFRVLAIIFVDEINNHKMKACDMERTAWSAWNIRLGSLEGLCSEYSQSVRSETLLLDNPQPKAKEGYILLTNWCQIMTGSQGSNDRQVKRMYAQLTKGYPTNESLFEMSKYLSPNEFFWTISNTVFEDGMDKKVSLKRKRDGKAKLKSVDGETGKGLFTQKTESEMMRMVLFETSLGFSCLKDVDFYSLTHDDYMEIRDLLYSICQVGPKKANITVNELI